MTSDELREKLRVIYNEGVACENWGNQIDYRKGFDTDHIEDRDKLIEEVVKAYEDKGRGNLETRHDDLRPVSITLAMQHQGSGRDAQPSRVVASGVGERPEDCPLC